MVEIDKCNRKVQMYPIGSNKPNSWLMFNQCDTFFGLKAAFTIKDDFPETQTNAVTFALSGAENVLFIDTFIRF